jgi:type II secretory pathway pseudopilin PulG
MRLSTARCCYIVPSLIAVVSLILVSTCASQTTARHQPEMPWSQDLNKYPGLPAEFAHLFEKLQRNVEFPPARSQSKLLPILPESTTYYAAFPNYGDAAHEALLIFRRELQQSEVLRDWWQHGELAAVGPPLEDFVEKFYEFSQYLGDEIVISGETGGTTPSLMLVAEVRKPGLKDFLRQMLEELPGDSNSAVLVLDPDELASVPAQPAARPVVLVRPELVVVAPSLDAVRRFNRTFEAGTGHFTASPFANRLAQAYQEGVSVLVGADLHRMLAQVPLRTQQNEAMFDRTGFQEAKFFVWQHRSETKQASSQMELSFTGPRHGVASWLASPAHLGSLDFVSPNAVLAASAVLKNPGEIFDEIRAMSSDSNPNTFAMVDQMQQATGINLKNDVLSHLKGEVTLELDDFSQAEPVWRAILRVEGADRLQQTLNRIFSSLHMEPPQLGEDGITYYNAVIPSAQKPTQIVYAFADGYMIVAPTRESAAEGVRFHKNGGSLAKSSKFVSSLPPGHLSEASGLLYEDPIAMMALQLKRVSPDMADSVSRLVSATTPMVVCAYGEETAIRGTSNSGGANASAMLVLAAIAIPNLLRARTAANEASAVATTRTIITAQVAYAATYPQKGYARDLASLGPDPNGSNSSSPEHASFLDARLGNPTCMAGAWCTKAGYRFTTTAVCKQRACKEFVVVGSPVSSNTGTRNFCSTADGVVRFSVGPPLVMPISASDCRQWTPMQ